MSERGESASEGRLSTAQRILHVAVGSVVGVAAAVLAAVLIAGGFTAEDIRGKLATIGAGLALAGLSGVGWRAVAQGLRGSAHSPRSLQAADGVMKRFGGTLTFVVGALILIAFRLQRGSFAPPAIAGDPMPALLWYVSAGSVLAPVQIAIHELGHVLGAVAVGIRVDSLQVGMLMLSRAGGRFRISLAFAPSGDFAGRTTYAAEAVGRWRYLVGLLSGPAASLASSAGCYLLWRRVDAAGGSTALAGMLLAGAVAGLFTFATTAFPYSTNAGMVSDGARALSLFRTTRGSGLLWQLYTVVPGRRPSDWGRSPRELAEAGRRAERPFSAGIFLYAQAIARDQGDHPLAHELLQEALQTASWDEQHAAWAWRLELELQAVMEDALVNGAVADARRRFDALPPHRLAPSYPLLAEASVALAEGNLSRASALLGDWHSEAERSGQLSRLLVGNEWAIDALRERIAAAGR